MAQRKKVAKKKVAKKKVAKKKVAKKKVAKKKVAKKKATKKKVAKKKATKKKATKKKTSRKLSDEEKAERKAKRLKWLFAMRFGKLYPLYLNKIEKNGRTKADVDKVIHWLTGYTPKRIATIVKGDTDIETFFAKAPRLNPNVHLITGVVCGIRVEEVEHPLMKKVRYLDKLMDELARGKKMESILRS